MPTSYTEGVMSGEVAEFNVFAKRCMRAMGATIHMRDDNLDTEYYPDKPSEYHINRLSESKIELDKIKNMSDDDIIAHVTTNLLADKKRYIKYMEDIEVNKKRLEDMLKKVKEYKPPTFEHEGIKTFMIEQLTGTIEFDCKTVYYEEYLTRTNIDLENIDPIKYRKERIAQIEKDIIYCTDEHQKNVDRCESRHKWVTTFLNSLK